jgi:hypothetical protein
MPQQDLEIISVFLNCVDKVVISRRTYGTDEQLNWVKDRKYVRVYSQRMGEVWAAPNREIDISFRFSVLASNDGPLIRNVRVGDATNRKQTHTANGQRSGYDDHV